MASSRFDEESAALDERVVVDGGGGGGSSGRGGMGRRGGGGGGGKKGGRGRGSGGGGGGDRDMIISKALSTLLRHQAANAGIKLDAEGYAPLDQVLLWPRLRSLKPTTAEIQGAVADNAKQRFSLKRKKSSSSSSEESGAGAAAADEEIRDPADWLIRANQGHSIKLASEALHRPVTLEAGNVPEVVVHGTYFAFWDRIVASGGLRRMGRTHVHFGTGLPPGDDRDHDGGGAGPGGEEEEAQVHDEAAETEAAGKNDSHHHHQREQKPKPKPKPQVISGMRADAELLVFVDVERSLRDGALQWWLSSNGVVLTEGAAGGEEDGLVPARYFREVRGRRQGVGVLWRDGERVADLPAGVVARAPRGKLGG